MSSENFISLNILCDILHCPREEYSKWNVVFLGLMCCFNFPPKLILQYTTLYVRCSQGKSTHTIPHNSQKVLMGEKVISFYFNKAVSFLCAILQWIAISSSTWSFLNSMYDLGYSVCLYILFVCVSYRRVFFKLFFILCHTLAYIYLM